VVYINGQIYPYLKAIKQAITELNCNPKVNQRVIELYTKKVQLLAELRKVEDEINVFNFLMVAWLKCWMFIEFLRELIKELGVVI